MSSENHNLFRKIATIPSRSHSAKNQITRRRQIGAEHSAPELLNSTAVAWVWNPVRPHFQAVNRDQTLGLRSVVPLASSSISSGATQSCRGAKLCFSYLPNHTLFLNRGQLRGTALHNDPPACNLFRLSATMHHSNPQTVDILCKPEENAPFPHKNRLRKRRPRPCGDQEFRRI